MPELAVKRRMAPSTSSTTMSGMSHHFFSCLENCRNSFNKDHMSNRNLEVEAGTGKEKGGRGRELTVLNSNAPVPDGRDIALTNKRRLDEAISQFQAALSWRPEYAEAHNGLGVALLNEGRVNEAMGQFEQAIKLKPGYVDAHCNLGLVLGGQGRRAEAIAQNSPKPCDSSGIIPKPNSSFGRFQVHPRIKNVIVAENANCQFGEA